MDIFEPTRLSLAMRRRGVTQRELAAMCGVTSQFISMLERSEKSAPGETLARIAIALRFPERFFFGSPVDLVSADALSFRAPRSMSSSERNQGAGAAGLVASVLSVDLEQRFRLPKLDVPDLSQHSPEEAAAILRGQWQLGYEPIQNMVHLLESRGVRVFWLDHSSSSMDAFMFWHRDRAFVILSSQKQAGDRARFNAAHELGHLVLHRSGKSLDGKGAEDAANKFASAFLLPRETFTQDCPDHPDLDALYRLKHKWRVSAASMVMRGYDLGLFTEWEKRQAFQRLNATGALKRENMPVGIETSRLHVKVFEALAIKGMDPAAYAKSLALGVEELVELMPLAQKFAEGATPPPAPPVVLRKKGNLTVISGGAGRSS